LTSECSRPPSTLESDELFTSLLGEPRGVISQEFEIRITLDRGVTAAIWAHPCFLDATFATQRSLRHHDFVVALQIYDGGETRICASQPMPDQPHNPKGVQPTIHVVAQGDQTRGLARRVRAAQIEQLDELLEAAVNIAGHVGSHRSPALIWSFLCACAIWRNPLDRAPPWSGSAA